MGITGVSPAGLKWVMDDYRPWLPPDFVVKLDEVAARDKWASEEEYIAVMTQAQTLLKQLDGQIQ